MQLKVNGRTIDKYMQVNVSLRYDGIASSFSFTGYFSPSSSIHRQLFIPCSFYTAEVSYNNKTLITGALTNHDFEDSSKKEPTVIGGYSKTGVLEDCTIKVDDATQMSGSTLKQIANRLIKPFALNLVVDDSVKSVCDEVIAVSEIDQYETIRNYLSSIASQKNVVLSHTSKGELLLTQANGNKPPIYNFTKGAWYKMGLTVDGQAMHSIINVKGQINQSTPDVSADAQILNPYLDNTSFGIGHGGFFPKFRPIVYQQTAATDPNTPPLTARKKLGNELKNAIRLKIDINGWTLDGNLPMPGDIITVQNADIFLYQKTKFFIQGVDFRGDEKSDTATLFCVLPESFNNDKIVNIFKGTNLTVPYSEPGAKATITPFI